MMPLSDSDAKGKLSAYQRWEMTSFEEPKAGATTKVSAESIAAAKSEMEKIRLKSQKEGFTKGFEEGYQAGLNNGQNEMQRQLDAFLQVSGQFNKAMQQAEQIVAQEVLDLALDLAKAMLKSTMQIHPEIIVPIVEQAIASLPAMQQPAQIMLNPNDAALVKHQIGTELEESGWAVVADPHMNQGDCRIETPKNQINASMQPRWQQLTDALGRDNRWYEPHPERKS
jgi:flagellar assembly protein FliH